VQPGGAHLLLGHLQRALVLADLQQLHHALLIRRKARNLADELAHDLHALAQVLRVTKAGRDGARACVGASAACAWRAASRPRAHPVRVHTP
jgi:hypothetical protein